MKFSVLNGNILKIIACVFMLLDHIGYILLPEVEWLRWVGRLAFPIFAFFIAEGCKYTRRKERYIILMFVVGIVMALVQAIATGLVYYNIFITFSFSIFVIYIMQYLFNNKIAKNTKQLILNIVLMIIVTVIVCLIAHFLGVDYGAVGVLVPVLFYLPELFTIDKEKTVGTNLYTKLLFGALGLVILSFVGTFTFQWVGLFSLILLACYNGERGKLKLKYFFYAFYPAHIVVLYLIQIL